MIDPVTAFAAASTAFRGVQTLVNHGRDIEEVFGALARWAGHVSDVQEWMGQSTKPSIFKKLTFQDDTKMAIEAVMYRQKIAAQEKEIREMFQWYGPPGAYEEFIKERRRIKAHREKTIYEQQRRRQAFIHNIGLLLLIIGIIGLIGFLISLAFTL